MSNWTYMRTEPSLWTVGFYGPDDKWHPDSDHGSSDEAAARVRWLNGGADESLLREIGDLRSRIDAAVALPGRSAAMTDIMTRLETVFIEENPFSGADNPVLDEVYLALPMRFYDALMPLSRSAAVDNTRCARCGDLTGFVIVGAPDGFDRPMWQPTALVREPDGPVAVLCGDCAPYVPDAPAAQSVGAK